MSSISLLNKTLNEEKMKFHDELNPAIWEGTKLKEKVAMKLMEIASNFVAYLDTDGFSIDDIIITGSMANYNYTDQSDIDLHIICDYSKLPTNCPILSQEYFQAKKKIYNDKHNIKIYGYDVELYVEDKSAPSLAGGKYSLLKREWLRFPQKIDFEVEDVIGTEELMDLITQIENVCMTDGNIQEAEELLNHIYEMRKSGLAQNGEFSFENLIFKALRNRGYLDKLRSYIAYAEDLSLSLNESVDNLEIKDEDGSLTLLQNGYIKAECSYTNYGDRIIIDWIESFDEGQGYATKLLEYIKNKYPNVKVISGEFVSSRIANVMKKIFGEPIRGEIPKAKDYDEYLDDESKSSDMEFRLNESYLTEGISDLAKQFPRIPEEKLRKFIALDPTYKGGEQAGKYGSWIIRLFYNNIKNADRMADYKAFYEKNNGINPKTGEVIKKPELLPQTPYEDAEKIPPLLKQYEVLKKEIGQPIDSFKSIQDLYTVIQQHTQKGVPQDKEALERYNVFKATEEKGLKEIYDDNEWIIGIPTTFESSKPFGQYTNWCTTSSGGTYYDRYLNQYGGEYYILLNKEDGALYQFHFESNQFMDERDYGIDMDNFTEAFPNIAKFLFEYKSKNGENPTQAKNKLQQKFAEIIQEPSKIQKEILYENYTSDVAYEGDNITGFFNLKYLSKYIYDNNARDGLNLETVCGLLTDFYDNFSFGDYSLYDYSYQSSDWDKIAKKYGIEKYNWDKICNIYQGNERPEEDDETVNTDIESLIQDDFADDIGLLGFLNNCSESGTRDECEKDILGDLSDNLPIYDNLINYDKDGDAIAKFSISKEDLWKIYYIMNKKSDDIPEYGKEVKAEKSDISEMTNKWYKSWAEIDDDYGYDAEAYDDWLYCWRVAKGKCKVDDFDYGAFVVEEPRYGWSGFDDKYFEVGCESAAKRIAEIIFGEDKKVANESFIKAEEKPKNLNESIAYVSKNDLSDIILKNPTRKEILEYDNPVLKHQDWRIAKDNNGNYYFGSSYDWIHFEMCNALKKQGIDIDVVFADYDGVASYDSKTNTFYIRDEYGEPELIEQEFNNSYLKKAFPNAKLEIDAEYDEMLESKQLNESIIFNDEVYDDFQEEYRKLTVWVNPSIDWIRNKLEEAGGFRFLHSIDKNKLYVFTVESGFMHQQVFDMLDFDWSKDGRNVVGVFNPDNSISIWEALADDGEASSSLKLAEELDGDLFKQIYPNGYELTICY